MMLTAKDIMNRDVIVVKKNTSILRAMELMLEKKISGMPVVADDMTLVGVITEMDVVSLAYNIIYDAGGFENKKVHHFMTDRVVSFDKDDNLFDVCDFLAKNLFRRVPITSAGKVVGIISVPDIIKYILQISRGICGKTTG
jgi:CBS domain-containing protein